MDKAKKSTLEESSLIDAEDLQQMTSSRGWKIVTAMMERLKDVERLKISPGSVDDTKLHTVTYIAGQIEAIDKLGRMINSAIQQGSKIIKERQKLPPE